MHVKVRCLLTGDYAVVLDEVQPFGIIRLKKGVGGPSDGVHHRDCFFIGQVEKSRSITSGGNVDLSQLELTPVHERKRLLGLLDVALVRAARNDLAQIAGVSRDRGLAPIGAAGTGGNLNRNCVAPFRCFLTGSAQRFELHPPFDPRGQRRYTTACQP